MIIKQLEHLDHLEDVAVKGAATSSSSVGIANSNAFAYGENTMAETSISVFVSSRTSRSKTADQFKVFPFSSNGWKFKKYKP